MIGLLQSTRSRHSAVSPEELALAIQAHKVAFYEAYGKDAGRPKHHAAAMHLADHYKRWGRLVPCFTHERFHKLAKSYASTRRNTTSYERGIIEDIAASQSCSNEEATFGYMGLVNPVAPTAKVLLRFRASPLIAKDAEIEVARVYTTGLFRIAKGDVVFWEASYSTKVGTVHLHFQCTARARPSCRHSPKAPETAGSCIVQRRASTSSLTRRT